MEKEEIAKVIKYLMEGEEGKGGRVICNCKAPNKLKGRFCCIALHSTFSMVVNVGH